MKPAANWAYVATQPLNVVPARTPAAQVATDDNGTPTQQLVGDLSGEYGGSH